MKVTKPNSAKPVAIGDAATQVPIVQANSALAPKPANEKPAAAGRGNVCIKNKTISKGTELSGGTRKKDTPVNTRRYPKRSESILNIVKRKYSLRSLPQQKKKKSARSKPLRKDEGSSTSLGEVNRSQMESSDEDEFGNSIESAVDEASDTSDSVDGIVDHDAAIIDSYDARWNKMYKRLRAFKESHGHCELFWLDGRFAFILNTPTNTSICLSS
jgi:hypothetical protein